MKLILTVLSFVAIAGAAVFSTNIPDKDAFVRALALNSNYGGAGALTVSGTNATMNNPTNGAFDTFMSFNTHAMVTNFNATLGANNWVITSATLNLTETPPQGNPVFNSGTGYFAIRWIANDTWVEGTGSPMKPTMDGITYGEEPSYLNSNMDMYLGAFDFSNPSGGTNVLLSCPLALPVSFVINMQAGGEVGLFLTAIDPSIGFVFYSRDFKGNTSVLPTLVVSATRQPVITSISQSGANLVLSATNGVTGGAYYLLTSTNIASPLNQWTPILTNAPAAGSNFTMTVTNAANRNAPSPQFFILQTY
jgi:hypothetical protein